MQLESLCVAIGKWFLPFLWQPCPLTWLAVCLLHTWKSVSSYDPTLISLVEFVINKIGKDMGMVCVLVEFGDPLVTTQLRLWCHTIILSLFLEGPGFHISLQDFFLWRVIFHKKFVHVYHVFSFLQFLLFPSSFCVFTLLCQSPFFFSSSIISNHFFYFLSCCSLPLFSFWLPSAGKRERNQVRLLFFVIFSLSFDFLFFRKNKALASDFPHISACAHEVRFPFPALFWFLIKDCFLKFSDIHW